MSDARNELERRCARLGIATGWHDIWGRHHAVPEASLAALAAEFGDAPEDGPLPPVLALRAGEAPWRIGVRHAPDAPIAWEIALEEGGQRAGTGRVVDGALEIGVALPMGYHRLSVEGLGETLVVATPERCWRPAALDDGGRVWGLALQLYALRSERNWGMGDLSDLATLVEQWAPRGAGIFGLNPLHALYPHNPAHASPYSPSSRLLLNVLYLNVEAIEDCAESEEAQRLIGSPEFQARLAELRAAELVDYPGVAAAKFEALEIVYAHFRRAHLALSDARARAFREFRARGGEILQRHALYDALQEHFHRADASVWGWQKWPEAYHDPAGDAVARFALAHAARVEYFEYLQWQAEIQLSRVAWRCAELGLALGLYLDLAVSVDRAGSDAWAHRDCYALGASVGAPPDDFNLRGQDWGLPPLRPDRLRATGYELYRSALREAMSHAGALRIDHVMGLMRLFWIPPGGEPADGAYVHYAFEELLAILALESHRNRCLVIGEDLGTVPDQVRAALARTGVLSYRLLWFERDGAGEFKAPADFPADALIAVSTHDLPTLAGWWKGEDLALRHRLGLYPDEGTYAAQRAARAEDRTRLARALERSGLLPANLEHGLAEAVHAYVAGAPARVMMVQLEDLLGVEEQANLPGTTDEHPNWRRKLPLALERVPEEPRAAALAARLAALRPRPEARTAAPAPPEARVPRATYRLQLSAAFTFVDAIGLVPYLAKLGVSHAYCSPILRARPGSTHGYDVVAHDQINPELGTPEDFERFVAALHAQGMGLLFDVVPNHVGIGADNAWWMDMLENGEASPYAEYFDVDWHPVNSDLEGKVLVPVLGDHYGNVLAAGELALGYDAEAGAFSVRYHEHRFPLDPATYPLVLRHAERALEAAPATEAAREALAAVSAALASLPPRDAEPEAAKPRALEKEALKQRLLRLARMQPDVAAALAAAVEHVNAPPGDALHALLEHQAYRLAYWLVAADEINYRRFFDVNDLAALRMENETVFEATHAFLFSLVAQGKVDGLRIDHPDGLFDPAQYFARLQDRCASIAGRPLYVVAEKITARHEHVPGSWALHGTTGYRFAAVVNGLFVDGAARARIDRIWRAFSGEEDDFEETAYEGKHAIMRGALAAELTMLASELLRIARADRRTRDFTFNALRRALAEVAACLPVYRTYISGKPSPQDRRYIDWAIARATRRSRAADTTIFSFVHQALLGRTAAAAPRALARRALRFAMRFQQFTAPVAAKGVEDTAFYRYDRLVSLNEVGSDPDMFGFAPSAFHGASADRAQRWPHTMLATSTHDNKRSEDVRQRINVISEMPGAWRLLLRRWSRLNRLRRKTRAGERAPSRSDEYLLYQTLLGTYPAGGLEGEALEAYRARIEAYMQKAAREAKRNTSWVSPNEEYEGALAAFVRAVLADAHPNPFLEDLRAQCDTVAWFGALSSLAMTLVKYGSPGVPDLYQGNELTDYSLVDPDNRRPVDYVLRRRLLEEIRELAQSADLAAGARQLAERPYDGRAKLLVTWRLLELRRELPLLFRDGGYEALAARGEKGEHVVAFARHHSARTLVIVAGRLFARLLGAPGRLPLGEVVWGDTAVAAGALAEGAALTNLLTGERIVVEDGHLPLARAFASFPAAALFV